MKDALKILSALFLVCALAGCSAERMSGFTDFNDPGKMAASYAAAIATITIVLAVLGQVEIRVAFGYGLGIPSVMLLVTSPFVYLKTNDVRTSVALGIAALMGTAIGGLLVFVRRKPE